MAEEDSKSETSTVESNPLPTFQESEEAPAPSNDEPLSASSASTTSDTKEAQRTSTNPLKRPQENSNRTSAYSSRFRDHNNNVNPYARNNNNNDQRQGYSRASYYEPAKRAKVDDTPMHPMRQAMLAKQPSSSTSTSTASKPNVADYERDTEEAEIARKSSNLDTTIRSHYNMRSWESRRSDRNKSPIIKLKHFNNAIKYMLIGNYTKPGDRVLDLGCGKGGDINKWEMAKVGEYVGIDISDASIKEAVSRYNRNGLSFPVTYVTGDAFGTALNIVLKDYPGILTPGFDVVSMQFCLHYGFENEEKAKRMIENVARSLKQGGKFIGTIPNYDFFRFKLKRLPEGEKSFGNSLYRVTFLEPPPRDGRFPSHYGNVYDYYLKDAIDNVPEYVVPFEVLRGLCEDYGLKLVEKLEFNDFFTKNIKEWYNKLNPKIIEGMRRRKDNNLGVEGDEAEATANFYLTFVFEKL
ncbi:hypothetical protein WICPIJ_006287 [Wickerhamomyces pijperi]|uniref:mRNA cap guanine-N(7) methyltransferase n=1 Tax=Wickerhamomyces pijperi TaxID=599730 RepID=A0A9P8Q435_WICPI|nr:hypothetical protein WICPIJ_006287 [Wickerhamomyces pijperi]